MSLTVFTAGTLSQPNVAATVSINPLYGGGTSVQSYLQDSLPIFLGAVNPAVRGVYISPAPMQPALEWVLSRHSTMTDQWQIVRRGGGHLLGSLFGSAPIATLTATDLVSLAVTSYTSGSLTLTSVQ